MKPKDKDKTTSLSDTRSKKLSSGQSNERSKEGSNDTNAAETEPKLIFEPAKQNQFLKAFGNIFSEMKGHSILQYAASTYATTKYASTSDATKTSASKCNQY